MDPDSMAGYILILLVLILTNAYFAMSEIAIIGLNDAKLKKMADEGDKKARRLYRLTSEPSRFLATIQVGVTLSGLLASAVAADTFARPIVAALAFTGVSPGLIHAGALVVITLLLGFFQLVFGELVPKRVAMKYPEPVAFAVSGSLAAIAVLERPFVALLSGTTNAIVRLFGINPQDDPEAVTEEEIRMMVDVGNERGVIEESDREMINNIFEFDDRTAVEVMTHRTDMQAVETDATLDEVVKVAVESGHSRIPVYEGSADEIKGILYVKDLLPLITRGGRGFQLSKLMRKPFFVPESTRCNDLFEQFTAKRLHMAVVVDEYGGTAGIVTMEDLVESIVGNIQDEYDNEEEESSQLSDNLYTLDGSLSLDEAERLLDLELEGDSDYETIGGLLVERLDHIPGPDEHPSLEFSGFRFTVTEADERRIVRLTAERLPAQQAPGEG